MANHARVPTTGTSLAGGSPLRKRWKPLAIGAVALGALALVAVAAWLSSGRAAEPLDAELDARSGSLHAASVEVPEGGFQLVLNQTPTSTDGSRTLNVEFENPAANAYAGTLTLRLEDGRVLGRTPAVEPGFYVRNLELQEALPAGVYPAVAEVALTKDGQDAGTSAAAVEVRVR